MGLLNPRALATRQPHADGHFDTVAALDEFLTDFSIARVDPSPEALFQAGQQFQRYATRRPDGPQCPSCGTTRTVGCKSCGEDLTPRQHIAADFVIGGHAAVDADALISFDDGFYGTYFPSLTIHPH